MSPGDAPPLTNIQSLQSLRLGCFVRDTKDIDQNIHEPFKDRPTVGEMNINSHGSFHETQALSKHSKFRTFLSDILSFSKESGYRGAANLAASRLTTHKLRNNSTWFEEACGRPETRAWMLSAYRDRYEPYLLVGFFVLTDARLATVRTSTSLGVAGAVASALPTGLAALSNAMTLIGGVRSTRDVSYGRISFFEVPGDQIFGIWYRKVKFKWSFSRETSNTPSLSKTTRWEPFWESRGQGDGVNNENVDDYYEEEPDIVELILEGESDWEDQKEDEDEGEDEGGTTSGAVGEENIPKTSSSAGSD